MQRKERMHRRSDSSTKGLGKDGRRAARSEDRKETK